MKRPAGVHHTGRNLNCTFLIFKQVKSEVCLEEHCRTPPRTCLWNSNLSEGGRLSGAVPVSPQLPGRGAHPGTAGLAGAREPCQGVQGSSRVLAATHQKRALRNMGSGKMNKYISKI